MVESGNDADLAQEAVGAEAGSQLGMQDLDRDLPAVPQVLGEEHRGHAAAADLRLDGVAVRECKLEAGEEVGGH
jgi:hypothetical protein